MTPRYRIRHTPHGWTLTRTRLDGTGEHTHLGTHTTHADAIAHMDKSLARLPMIAAQAARPIRPRPDRHTRPARGSVEAAHAGHIRRLSRGRA